MYAKTHSASVFGISAFPVEIEAHIENGLPAFQIVGLPDGAIRESRERVLAAIKNSKYEVPPKRIVVNLAPADVRKEGSAFDLSIAVGILWALGQIALREDDSTVLLGELAFDGSLRPIHGVLPIAMMCQKKGVRRLLVPARNADEGAIVEGLDVVAVETLTEAVAVLTGELTRKPHRVDINAVFAGASTANALDMREVKGQQSVKRALEIAAAGGHNIIMIGPPGAGKTMLAKRLPTILPPITLEESLETTKIHSVAGLIPPGQALVSHRPFRSPHHTISDSALIGGGVGTVRAGEISLAHHGVLFLDEVPEFQRNVLEVLRQPLEDKCISISRSRMSVKYPANVMLVCSMNPCPCGFFGSANQECQCKLSDVQKYMSRVSGPLLDRIDIHIDVPGVRVHELTSVSIGEASESIRSRVVRAREIQRERFDGQRHLFKNADMASKDIERICILDAAGSSILQQAMTKLGLSARAYDRILKVSRTIADLAGSTSILSSHVAEAVQYRSLDRSMWLGAHS